MKHGCLRNELNPSRGTTKLSARYGKGSMVPCNTSLMCHQANPWWWWSIYESDRGWNRRRGPRVCHPVFPKSSTCDQEGSMMVTQIEKWLASPTASASCPPEPWRDGPRTWDAEQERPAQHWVWARERPLNGRHPWCLNFPEGANQVLGTKLNKEALKNSHCRGFKWYTANQPVKRRMIRGEHCSQQGGLGSSWI